MKQITLFVLKYCGYCRRALQLIDSVKADHADLEPVPIHIIDEGEQRELARKFDYYFVPTFYIESVKIHEGPVDYNQVLAILRQAQEAQDDPANGTRSGQG
ncbi:MAG: glutaredoxin domain-containing protein [Bacillota bacterium]|nr:glutaredoxin domain-containing protein [Bacillota bacterium]